MVSDVFQIPFALDFGRGNPRGGHLLAGGGRSVFTAGPENRLVQVAIQMLLTAPRRPVASPCPLVLYGPAGTGKSVLAQAVGQYWPQRWGPVLFTTGPDWHRSYGMAVKHDELPAWRQRCRDYALFVLDDAHLLHKRFGAQRELAAFLDDLESSGGLALLTCGSHPAAAQTLVPTLRSRLSGGLAIPVRTPGFAAREQIIQQCSADQRRRLAPAAAAWLAHHFQGNVSQLRSLVTRCLNKPGPSPPIVQVAEVRAALALPVAGGTPSVRQIITAVARYFGMTARQITGASRRQAISRARGIAIYLARSITSSSLKEIGSHFGNRDHTTVIHAVRITEERRETDLDVRLAIEELRQLLTHQAHE